MIINIRTVRRAARAVLSAGAAVPMLVACTSGAHGEHAAGSLTVVARDADGQMVFDVTGRPVAGLVDMTYRNNADEAHELTIGRLKPGVTLGELKAAFAKGDSAASALLVDPHGEITGPAILAPGRSERVTVRLAVGHYAVVCFLPAEDGKPHVAHGMLGQFTVASGGTDAAGAPRTRGRIELTDDHISVPHGFGAGGTYAVTNTGTRVHDFSVARLDGAALPAYFQCVGASFAKFTPIDKCPGKLQGGVTALPPGATAYLTLDLPSGTFYYVSTQGNGADFRAGLHGRFTVG